MGIHRPGVPEVVKAPHLIQKLIPGKDHALILRQLQQKVEFLGRQVDRLAVHRHGAGLLLDAQPAEGRPGSPLLPAGAFQHRAHPGHQLLGAERLGNIVVRAQIEAQQLVIFLTPGGEHDDRGLGKLPQLPQRLKAVLPRHHHV